MKVKLTREVIIEIEEFLGPEATQFWNLEEMKSLLLEDYTWDDLEGDNNPSVTIEAIEADAPSPERSGDKQSTEPNAGETPPCPQ